MQLFGYKNDSWEIKRCDQPIESFEKRHYIADHHSYGIFLSDSCAAWADGWGPSKAITIQKFWWGGTFFKDILQPAICMLEPIVHFKAKLTTSCLNCPVMT